MKDTDVVDHYSNSLAQFVNFLINKNLPTTQLTLPFLLNKFGIPKDIKISKPIIKLKIILMIVSKNMVAMHLVLKTISAEKKNC
jgi:hypothetical protein